MCQAVWDPCEDIEDDGLVGGEDVAEVCAVEDVFEGWEDADPDWRSVFTRDEPGREMLVCGLDQIKYSHVSPGLTGKQRRT